MRRRTDSLWRALLIGALPPKKASPLRPIGGGLLNFAEMVEHLGRSDFEIDVVDSARVRHSSRKAVRFLQDVGAFVRVVATVAWRLWRADVVVFNISAGRAASAAAFFWALCRVARRPLVLRFFGGDFAQVYGDYRPWVRWWADSTYMRSERVFVQTLPIYRRFRDRGNVRWFPNTRNVRAPLLRERKRITRFIFLSRLHMDKGLGETLKACRDLPSNCHLDVFGPRMPDTDFSLFDAHGSATYGGELHFTDVPSVLASYDVLLFPSYWHSEGQPGVVIEALQCGIPVIATRWGGIPEIVDHETNGLLIEPRSATALREAIERLLKEPGLYRRLCTGARARGEFFRSGIWYDWMSSELRKVIRA